MFASFHPYGLRLALTDSDPVGIDQSVDFSRVGGLDQRTIGDDVMH
jgi:hypothetical protein